jgi:flavin-dependent dehydrogenase
VIIGGGPGGTACALALKRLATEQGRRVKITIIEGKRFIEERHYNQCVGVLSPPLPELMEEDLGIPFPRDLCLVEIGGYVLHGKGEEINLVEGKDGSIAVRRVLFDAYMLEQVIKQGIDVWPFRATDLEFHSDRVVVYTENQPMEADVVVGAFGLDEGSTAMFSRLTDYRPPQALDSIVTKYNPEQECLDEFGPDIHAFLPANRRIEFGAVTPKCDHLTINIAGKQVDADLMDSFLQMPEVKATLPQRAVGEDGCMKRLEYFKGRFPRSLAKNYYGDRYVMVGDASGLVRAFKGKGSTTAVLTGIRAAETIMHHGISRQAFHDHYRAANQDIVRDLPYGRFMRLLTISMSQVGFLDTIIRAAAKSQDLREALFNAVSAHGSYQGVLRRSLRPGTIRAIIEAFFQRRG